MEVDYALQKSKVVLPTKRYEHVERVTETALSLAEKYHADQYNVGIAAALHDYAKHMDKSLLQYWIETSIDIPKDLIDYHHELWHGPVGAKMIQHWFMIENKDILNAVRWHTTGRAKMGLVEKIIFLADYIEPGRQFDAVYEARDLAQHDLDRACQYALKQSILFLIDKKQPIYPDTFQAYNELTKSIKKDGGN
ncbi:bis(5'-nucleosyl)-tetraphosphatase (symmetrical) YqeK [Alkalibacillus haloalkaliphilus]|uniref:bis(5'-nucleosyl)-tetraphosphatase (symmetrical) YqeK n=1 Tax=Alkalibacillus haloalkaliphilus TaxID=94136 RepID=UPI0002DAB83C|nr:bis(5'-nucleosyl)-tetraphosphatase (symmetrical) YqeK [Alkalibacillus haloalkaliphilus]